MLGVFKACTGGGQQCRLRRCLALRHARRRKPHVLSQCSPSKCAGGQGLRAEGGQRLHGKRRSLCLRLLRLLGQLAWLAVRRWRALRLCGNEGRGGLTLRRRWGLLRLCGSERRWRTNVRPGSADAGAGQVGGQGDGWGRWRGGQVASVKAERKTRAAVRGHVLLLMQLTQRLLLLLLLHKQLLLLLLQKQLLLVLLQERPALILMAANSLHAAQGLKGRKHLSQMHGLPAKDSALQFGGRGRLRGQKQWWHWWWWWWRCWRRQ